MCRSRDSAGLKDFSLMILFLKVLYGGNGLLLELSVVGLEGITRVDKSKLLILAESLVWTCVEIGV